MNRIQIIRANSENITQYGLCGCKSQKHEGYRRKAEWLKQRFQENLRYQILRIDGNDAGLIEYVPGPFTWRSINADDYMVIHCLLVEPKYRQQGFGRDLIRKCLDDAKTDGLKGVAAVVSQSAFLAEDKIFKSLGFEVVDRAVGIFELLAFRFDEEADPPSFKHDWQPKLADYPTGLTIIHSDQCPFIAKAVKDIHQTALEMGLETKLIKLETAADSQNAPTPYGVFGIIYNGELLTERPISNGRFKNIMKKVLKD